MGIFDRYKSKKRKEEAVSPAIVQSEAVEEMPSEELSVTEINTPSPLDNSAIVEKETGQQAKPATVAPAPALAPVSTASVASSNAPKPFIPPAWVHAGSFEEAAKIDPKITRSDYIYKRGKYRREQGLPDMDLAELNKILGGKDPYETEEQRLKREKNMRVAKNINALGTFLNALVNYNRVKRGHVGYTPDKGTETYNRLERIRTGQEQLAQSRAKDYLDVLQKDRIQRRQEELVKAQEERARREHEYKIKDLEWKMENAKTEAARKQAADELAREKFEWNKQQKDKEFKLKEKEAAVRESQGWARINKQDAGNIATSAPASDGSVWTRSKPLSREEAMRLVMSSEMGKNQEFIDSFRATSTTTNEDGETIRKGDVNWFEAVSRLMAEKKIPSSVLSSIGYKEYQSAPKGKLVEGYGKTSGARKTSKMFD